MQLKSFYKVMLWKYKFYILVILISGAIIVTSTSSIPYYIGLCFQQIKDNSHIENYSPLVFLSIFFVLRSVFKLVRNHTAALLGTSFVMQLRLHSASIFGKNYAFQNSINHTDLYSLLTFDLDTISNILSFKSFMFLEDMFILTLSFIIMAHINTVVFLSICPFLAGLFIISFRYGQQISPIIYNIRRNISNISEVIYENIIAQKAIRTLYAQSYENGKFDKYNSENLDLNKTLNDSNIKNVPLMELFALVCMLISVVLSSYLVSVEKIELSAVIMFYGYMALLIGTTKNLSSIITFFINSKQSIIRILETLECFSNSNEYKMESMLGIEDINKISLIDISYKVNEKDLLKNISLVLEKGKITTITGEIGCGKTTLADIISGINLRFSGILLVNETEMHKIDIRKYRDKIGYATQEPIFVNASILHNITLHRDNISKEQLSNAILACAVDDIIAKLDSKLDKVVNKDSVFLSGGEKQRICLARAFLSNPQVLVIDDTITAIDSDNQRKIINAVLKMKTEKIVVFISNLKSIIEISDEVYDLSSGCLKKIK